MEVFLIALVICAVVAFEIWILQRGQASDSSRRPFSSMESGQHPLEYEKKPSHKVSVSATHSQIRETAHKSDSYPYEEITWATREEVWTKYVRQKGQCFFCAIPIESRDNSRLDYIIPLTRGGKRELENLVVTCPACNHIKGRRKRNREIWQKRIRAGQRFPERSEVLAIYSRQRRQHRRARAPGSFSQADIDRIYRQQDGRCQYCGIRVNDRKDYHVDHVVPLSRGGTNYPDNLVIACKNCNISKGDKLLHEWPERPTRKSPPVSRPSTKRKRFSGNF